MHTPLRTNQRRGYTLVELLVVIAIIGVLIALLLPAVQAARESARVTQCKNNMKQIGLAAHQHHDVYHHLPPGIGYYTPGENIRVFGTDKFHLLPFLEQGNLYGQSFGTAQFLPPVGPMQAHYLGNNNVYSQRVAVFNCPSDPSDTLHGVVMVDGVQFGALSYPINALLSARNPLTTSSPIDIPQGRTRLAEITDGTSNTILHAEKYVRCTNSFMAQPFRDGGTAWAYATSVLFPWLPPPLDPPGKAFYPGICIPALVARGAPNAIGPGSKFQVRPTPYLGNCDPTRASTAHAAMTVGMADGSVRSLAPAMSDTTWWWAITPSTGEVLGSDW